MLQVLARESFRHYRLGVKVVEERNRYGLLNDEIVVVEDELRVLCRGWQHIVNCLCTGRGSDVTLGTDRIQANTYGCDQSVCSRICPGDVSDSTTWLLPDVLTRPFHG